MNPKSEIHDPQFLEGEYTCVIIAGEEYGIRADQVIGIFKKPVSYKIEAAVHKWGMIFFFGLLFLITVKDIRQFVPF